MKKTILLVVATAAFALASVGCSASAKIDLPRSSTTKPSKDVQVAYVTKTDAEKR